MSEKRLNACFRKAFGTTIFETLRNHRPDHARQALEAGPVVEGDRLAGGLQQRPQFRERLPGALRRAAAAVH